MFLGFYTTTKKGSGQKLTKLMDNPRFVGEETIPLVQDEDYDDYNTPNTSSVDDTSFTEPDTTEATSTLQLRQKVKQDKITVLQTLECDR